MNRYYYNKRYIMEDYNKGEGFNLKDNSQNYLPSTYEHSKVDHI